MTSIHVTRKSAPYFYSYCLILFFFFLLFKRFFPLVIWQIFFPLRLEVANLKIEISSKYCRRTPGGRTPGGSILTKFWFLKENFELVFFGKYWYDGTQTKTETPTNHNYSQLKKSFEFLIWTFSWFDRLLKYFGAKFESSNVIFWT